MAATAAKVTAWDAQGKPITQGDSTPTAWDANGRPIPVQSATPDVYDAKPDVYDPNPYLEGLYGLKSQTGETHWVPFSKVGDAKKQGMTFGQPDWEWQYNKDNELRNRLTSTHPHDYKSLLPSNGQIDGQLDLGAYGREAVKGLSNVGAFAMQLPLHPVSTAEGYGKFMLDNSIPAMAVRGLMHPLEPDHKSIVSREGIESFTHHPLENLEQMVGQGAVLEGVGEGLGSKPMEPVRRVAANGLDWMADKAQDTAGAIMNHTVGARKSDFGLGGDQNNPGKGYFQGLDQTQGKNALTPWWKPRTALTMRSLADKAANVKEAVGQDIGNVIDETSKNRGDVPIDARDVRKAIDEPFNAHRQTVTGAFGGGDAELNSRKATFDPYFKTKGGMSPVDPDTGKPVGADLADPFTPRELWDMKKTVADNTRWVDPASENLNHVGQQVTGGLSNLLNSAVPELRPLNEAYGNLTPFAARALERANTGSMPMMSMMRRGLIEGLGGAATGFHHGGAFGGLLGGALGLGLESVPAKTFLASSLWDAGNGLRAMGDITRPGDLPFNVPPARPTVAKAAADLAREEADQAKHDAYEDSQKAAAQKAAADKAAADKAAADKAAAEKAAAKTAAAKGGKAENAKAGEKPSVKVGDYVQWVSQGMDQFKVPKKVASFSEDGSFAFFEGEKTGAPVEELELDKAAASKAGKGGAKNTPKDDPTVLTPDDIANFDKHYETEKVEGTPIDISKMGIVPPESASPIVPKGLADVDIAKLKKLGWDDDTIAKLSPDSAEQILKDQKKAPPITFKTKVEQGLLPGQKIVATFSPKKAKPADVLPFQKPPEPTSYTPEQLTKILSDVQKSGGADKAAGNAPSDPKLQKIIDDFGAGAEETLGSKFKRGMNDLIHDEEGSFQIPDVVQRYMHYWLEYGDKNALARLKDLSETLRGHEADLNRDMKAAIDKSDAGALEIAKYNRDNARELRKWMHVKTGGQGEMPEAAKIYDGKEDHAGYRRMQSGWQSVNTTLTNRLKQRLIADGYDGYRNGKGEEIIFKNLTSSTAVRPNQQWQRVVKKYGESEK